MRSNHTLPILLLLLIAMTTAQSARADLDAYLKKPDASFRWKLTGTHPLEGGTVYDIQMTSQTWQGIDWEHHLQLFRPDHVANPHFCGLYNTGGNGGAQEEQFGMMLAKRSGTLFANLYGIPKQPLYGGKTEDALVVYTWQKFLETGDETWPLHFPMAKAVLRALDVIQAAAKQEKLPEVKQFMVCGASKRGWTTWLVGASKDKRVKAIAPMVIDTLNVAEQLPHQLNAFGKPSEQIDDYTNGGMLQALKTERGKKLLELEDPYSYRDRLTLPKLLILGTNDRYWAQDALNLYWDGLKSPKWVSYTPNSGHGLEDRRHVYDVLTAYLHAVATNTRLPKPIWSYQNTAAGASLTVRSDMPFVGVKLYRVNSASTDFRDSKWSSTEPVADTAGKTEVTLPIENPTEGYSAVFGEMTYKIGDYTFTLSTQIKILGKP